MTAAAGLSLKSLVAIQFFLGAAFAAAVAWLFGLQLGASFGVGALLMLSNLLVLGWVWSRILAKKSFALTLLIIVVKYTFLLGAIFVLTQTAWFHVISGGLGMATFIMTALFQVAAMKRE
jgi:hypothetical protein